jgi:Di-haem oxidoreductase, putative peroxidase
MGENLADGVSQGIAGPDEFRAAPLWGIGERLVFLHDGRTSDLLAAIKAHASPILDSANMTTVETFEIARALFAPLSAPAISCGSEANAVIFNALTGQQQQDILNFLRSLRRLKTS